MTRRRRLTPTEARLVALIDDLIFEVEESRCTCPSDPDIRNSRHVPPGRRRTDSACQGVASAVRAEMKKRRALRPLMTTTTKGDDAR